MLPWDLSVQVHSVIHNDFHSLLIVIWIVKGSVESVDIERWTHVVEDAYVLLDGLDSQVFIDDLHVELGLSEAFRLIDGSDNNVKVG